MIHEITDTDFKTQVKNSKEIILIDFWAEWCGPCKALFPIVEELSLEMKDTIKFLKMNIDKNPDTPTALAVRSIPTLIIFKNGEYIASKTGMHTKNVLKKWIESSI